jgi:uncharacterized membrane protein
MHALIAVATYVFTPVVVPGHLQSVWAPNDRGQIPVNTDKITGIYRHGTVTPLPTPPAGYEVGAIGINNSGVIVGSAVPSRTSGPEVGFILRGTTYTFFSRPGWPNTEPRGIGNSGLVIGWSFNTNTGQSAGFIYDPATGTFTDATPPDSNLTIIQGINKFGRIAGNGLGPRTYYAVIWQQQVATRGARKLANFLGQFQMLDGGTRARGINDAGVIAGFAFQGGRTVGFVGNISLGFQVLIPPGGDAAGAGTYCPGLNNLGQVVCAVTDAAGAQHAFIASPNEDGEDERER